jgi:hypothetical protein
MSDRTETTEYSLDPTSQVCLATTRSSVLNVLVGVGAIVALTGFLLRRLQAGVPIPLPDYLKQALYVGLMAIFLASIITRRWLGRRARLREPSSRCNRFYWGHVIPAIIGAIAAPLGLVYGWLVSPQLEAILPFWMAALVLGVLSYPRGGELDGFDAPMTPSGERA